MTKRTTGDPLAQPEADPSPGARPSGRRRPGFGFRRRWHAWMAKKGILPAPTVLTLSSVPSGESVCIRDVQGGHAFLSRLACLGFTPGVCVRVVQNYGHGAIIVALRDTRVALGRGEASRVLVAHSEEGTDAA